MSHRIKRFAEFAIFALFYRFVVLDSISGLFGHQVDTKLDTKSGHRNDFFSLPEIAPFWCPRSPLAGVFVPLALPGSASLVSRLIALQERAKQ
jgi:hypothetical protein